MPCEEIFNMDTVVQYVVQFDITHDYRPDMNND